MRRMLVYLAILALVLGLANPVLAGPPVAPGVYVSEIDGAPASQVYAIKFTNGSVSIVAGVATVTTTGGTGYLQGPGSSTDNAIMRWDGINGLTAQNSLVTIDDAGTVNIPAGQTYRINGTALTYTDVGAAATSHNHAGTAINSSVVGSTYGGTGLDMHLSSGVVHVSSGTFSASAVVESDITLADNTTNDVSTAKHGLVPKLDNVATHFLNGQGTWATPAGASFADIASGTNANALVIGTGGSLGVSGSGTITATGLTNGTQYYPYVSGASSADWAQLTGAGIANNTITATQLSANLAFVDGDLLDLSAVTQSAGTDEGFTLPAWADVTPATSSKRFLAWDETNGVLRIFTGAGWLSMNPGAGAPTQATYLTLTGDTNLTAERTWTNGGGITSSDGGANGPFTVSLYTSTATGNRTWSDGTSDSSIAWTWNLSSGTDPVLTLGDGLFNVSTGTIQQGGVKVALGLGSSTAGSVVKFSGTDGQQLAQGATLDDLAEGTTYKRVVAASVDANNNVQRLYVGGGAGYATIAGPTAAIVLTIDDASQTLAARNTTNTFTEDNIFGNADTDIMQIRSMIYGGNSREVQINAGTRTVPTYPSGTPTQDL